jgi:hypothetical protein
MTNIGNQRHWEISVPETPVVIPAPEEPKIPEAVPAGKTQTPAEPVPVPVTA